MERFGAAGWKPEQLGDVSGKFFVITGGNSGIGFEAARILAGRGAEILILCRNPEKADSAVKQIKAEAPQADVRAAGLNLSDLSSVEKAAGQIARETDRIDALVLNAGIMMTPNRELTEDGFEVQIGVNHLGHFALAGQLIPLVKNAGGRVVSVASLAHKYGLKAINFDDLNWEKGYNPVSAYAQSKLANLLFIHELNNRLQAEQSAMKAVSCHPGYSATNLQSTGPGKFWGPMLSLMNVVFAQKAEYGSYPTLLAAADDRAKSGSYYGPTGFRELGGPVGETQAATYARDDQAAARLWAMSAELTGVVW